jgi:hypothetical protein
MRNWKGRIEMSVIHLLKFNSGEFAIIKDIFKGVDFDSFKFSIGDKLSPTEIKSPRG